MANDPVGGWVLVAAGAGLLSIGAWIVRGYWSLWRKGVETRATIVRAFSPTLGNARFQDLTGQDHLIEKCAPPRFGKLVEGDTRKLTYLPWQPARWEWGLRKDQRFLVFVGVWVVAIGVLLAAAGVKMALAAPRAGAFSLG